MRCLNCLLAFLVVIFSGSGAWADEDEDEDLGPPLSSKRFKGLALRSIGPALMSGRIADIALHPRDSSTWFVAVGSGGVWKTENAGTTWRPIFDEQESYSIGCVAIDPSEPNTVWVGTGENVGGRHVGFGDGVYKSIDGGENWTNVGLKASEHIAQVLIHPKDSDTVWVAAEGPLWSAGGDRGLYKTTDGGQTWKRVLSAGPWTGVTSLVIDPRDPDVLYAATWQRHRTVAAYMGGGPESGIHRSVDGGDTWQKLTEGLPKKKNMGKIGLAISPIKPDVVYATIELDRRTGGVWRSSNRGATWEKGAEVAPTGTGPHYYQELYASPHHFDRIYLADVQLQVSTDGGKSFDIPSARTKHSDHHALEFRSDDPDYLLAGTDGGLYESFDLGKTWRFMANLPVTQFYKVAVDDAEPFYTVYGGTQDNNTQGGPSRTDNANGIRNADWFITLFADGHQPATEPGNPDIMYSEAQQGVLFRIDRTTGEKVFIQPQPAPGEPVERFNWDSPILVSPHAPTRLYYGSQRVWRSEDRGDTWTAISGDLTKKQDRMLLPLMGRKWSWDATWDFYAMSDFNTVTSLAESPKQAGLLYAGTDDGLIQVSENGGKAWRRTPVGDLPGVPRDAFVNDIKADLFEPNTVYIALDNHKAGDFKPYLLKSTDRGRRWRSIRGDLPDRHLVWRIVQDHVRPELLFAATEFGLFFTVDGGKDWTKLEGGAPPIPFRDLVIQRRESDLVGASFGRGFYILDDYGPLRTVSAQSLEQAAMLFPIRDAWWYVEREPLGASGPAFQGDGYYVAENPPFGAMITYYLKESLQTREERRQASEKKTLKKDLATDTPFPGWDAVEAERREAKPSVLVVIQDAEGRPIRRLSGPTKAGVHRISWNLRGPPVEAMGWKPPPWVDPDEEPKGPLVAPGQYAATLYLVKEGRSEQVGEPVSFSVKRMSKGALAGASPADAADFWRRVAELRRAMTAATVAIEQAEKHIATMSTALERSRAGPGPLDKELEALRLGVDDVKRKLFGLPSMQAVGESGADTVERRLNVAMMGTMASTYGPTPTHQASLELAETWFEEARERMSTLLQTDLPTLQKKMVDAGAPWTRGQPIPSSAGTRE